MVATLESIQQTYVDPYLGRADGDTLPWTDAQIQGHVQTALDRLWRDNVGLLMTGDVATNPAVNTYTLPTSMLRIRRIDLVDASGVYVDRITDFRVLRTSDAPTSFVVQPLLASGYTMRLIGWKKIVIGTLPTELEAPLGYHATSLSWGQLSGRLLNSRRQQNEDSGRVVSYQDALQNRDYWMAAYREAIEESQYRVRIDQVSAYR